MKRKEALLLRWVSRRKVGKHVETRGGTHERVGGAYSFDKETSVVASQAGEERRRGL